MQSGTVRGLGHRGEGVVAGAHGPVFVRGALPGEEVRYRLNGRRRGVARASLVEVVKPSADRQKEVPCALESRCGGCPLMALQARAQHAQKLAWVREALAQGAGADLPLELVAGTRPLGYRRRARLAFEAGTRRQLGYRQETDRRLVDVDRCAVLDPCMGAGLELARRELLPLLEGRGEVLLAPGGDGRPVLWLQAAVPQSPALYQRLHSLVDASLSAGEQGVAGASLTIGAGAQPATFGDPRQCVVGHDGLPLWGPVGAFTQSNTEVNRQLVSWVQAQAQSEGRRVLELFAGHGNLTIALAPGSLHYEAIEWEAAAVEACRGNLAARGLRQVRVRAGDAAGAEIQRKDLDLLVLDPPRTGAREVIERMPTKGPRRIVYVSCDPATLGRDLGQLARRGYRIVAAQAFDMFPQTAHVEAAVCLVPAAGH